MTPDAKQASGLSVASHSAGREMSVPQRRPRNPAPMIATAPSGALRGEQRDRATDAPRRERHAGRVQTCGYCRKARAYSGSGYNVCRTCWKLLLHVVT